MAATRGNLSEKSLEKVSGEKPVSLYSLSFTQIVNDAEREFLIARSKVIKPKKLKAIKIKRADNRSSFSKRVFNWRNAAVIAAILAVGVLQFIYQLSVIKTENTQLPEPPAKSKQIREQPAVAVPAAFDAKKVEIALPEKPAPVIRQPKIVRQSEVENAPSKLPLKKKEAVETRAERLRRAEKILTGI